MVATKSEVELREFTLALARAQGVGPRTFQKLLQHYGGIDNIRQNFLLKQLPSRLQQAVAVTITIDWQELIPPQISYICYWEESYPVSLRNIADPPIVLFYVGDIQLLKYEQLVSVVGTRNATAYGKSVTQQLVHDLVVAGYVVVSGMATGIDKIAHETALQNGGHTIAVLPTAPHIPVPAINFQLHSRICEKGLVISETFPDIPLSDGMFPQRNRIVAGLSQSTIVTEAAEKSGALITANLAFNYGREVYAVPGRITDISSRGVNRLIENTKATLLLSVSQLSSQVRHKINDDKMPANLSPHEIPIVTAILKGAVKLEDICAAVDRTAEDVISLLMVLQIKQLVAQDTFGDYFVTKIK